MDDSKFDLFLTRLRKITGTLLLLILLVSSLWFVLQIRRAGRAWHGADREVSIVDKKTGQTQQLLLGSFSRLDGTPLLTAPLSAKNSGDFGKLSSGYGSGDIKNYLLFDSLSKTSRWLLTRNSSLILKMHELVREPTMNEYGRRKEDSVVTRVLYQVVENDTNNDRELDNRDRKSLLLLTVEDGKSRTLLSNVDDVLGVHQISSEETLIFFSDSKRYYSVSLNRENQLGERKDLVPIASD